MHSLSPAGVNARRLCTGDFGAAPREIREFENRVSPRKHRAFRGFAAARRDLGSPSPTAWHDLCSTTLASRNETTIDAKDRDGM
jgi:hypothetical protein